MTVKPRSFAVIPRSPPAPSAAGRPVGDRQLVGVRMGQRLPLVQQAGIHAADELAQPGDQIVQILGPRILRDGPAHPPVGVREVPQHHAF